MKSPAMLRSRLKIQTALAGQRWMVAHTLALLLVLAAVLAQFGFMSAAPLLSDESFNFRQITRFLNGDFSLEPEMNVIPGYHALVALALSVFNKSGVFSARLFSAGIAFASVLAFYMLAWKVSGRPSLAKTLQYTFFPLLFPFFALVYTDILALLLVLLAVYLILSRRYTLAGLAGILSVLARTNNIAWFGFLYAFAYYQEYGLDWRALPGSLRKTWIYWLGSGLFLAFVVVNGGIALTNKEVQPLFRFELGNVYFLLFLFAFLFLPLNLANLSRIIGLLRTRGWALPALLGVYLIFLLTFESTHPYNQTFPDYYIRNQLLMTVTSGLIWKSAFFLPVAFALLSLAVTRLRELRFYWLYPFTALSLVPFWLIEPRYAFVPLSLFILFKEERSAWIEGTTLVFYVILSVMLVYLTRYEIMFI